MRSLDDAPSHERGGGLANYPLAEDLRLSSVATIDDRRPARARVEGEGERGCGDETCNAMESNLGSRTL